MDNHPLSGFEINVYNFKCFDDSGSDFFSFLPTNIVIGKNNSGKSTIGDIAETIISNGQFFNKNRHAHGQHSFKFQIRKKWAEAELRKSFSEHSSGGDIPGRNHWDFGKRFVGEEFEFYVTEKWNIEIGEVEIPSVSNKQARQRIISNLQNSIQFREFGNSVRRIAAERHVGPEKKDQTLDIKPNGSGTTNLVRAFLNNENLPRSEIEIGLLDDINSIFDGDAEFETIVCQENDETSNWEIFLREKQKGDIRLSESGSGLQSIFILCCILRLTTKIDSNFQWNSSAFIFEEPENNLHPALLRRVLDFTQNGRKNLGFSLILTTHSPICIDWSTANEACQVLHVEKIGLSTKCTPSLRHKNLVHILDDLDIRGSDILQSNGIIWVEGPSDRIFLNKWIELFSENQFHEGTDYRVMFYGGRILSHFSGESPSERPDLVEIFSINRNSAIIIDSDRKNTSSRGNRTPSRKLNNTKLRILREMEKIITSLG